MRIRGYRGQASFSYTLERDGEKFLVTVTGGARYIPGVFNALPENCYPDDVDEEIFSVVDVKGKDWVDELTSQEEAKICALLHEKVSSRKEVV